MTNLKRKRGEPQNSRKTKLAKMSTEEQAAFRAEERARRAKKQAEKNEEELAI
jgi:hypothetical protein